MKRLTFKARLALWFTVLVALILGIFGTVTYAYAKFLRARQFYSELRADAVASATIVLRSDNLSESALQPFRRKLLNKLPHESVGIFDLQNRVAFHSGERPVQLDSADRDAALSAGLRLRTVRDTQMVFMSFEDEDKTYVVAIAAQDIVGLRTLAKLRIGLLLSYPVALLAVYVLGSWFAGRTIAPIARITRQAEGVSASDLHVRIEEGTQQDELSHLAHAFNGMLDRLETAFRSQRQFIANASHELRTPLTSVEGQLEVALMQPRSTEEYRTLLSSVYDDVRALKRSTNNLLLLARAESGWAGRRSEPQRLDEILFSALEEAKRRHAQRTVEVAFANFPDDEARLSVVGNGDLLRSAVANVLDNALKYSPAGEPIKITLASTGSRLQLQCADRGLGISPEEQQKVFQPFYRGAAVHSIPGSGIGLALVKAIVELHQGMVTLTSTPGQGTTVVLDFPSAA